MGQGVVITMWVARGQRCKDQVDQTCALCNSACMECDLSPQKVLHVQQQRGRVTKGWIRTHTLLEMTKSLGVHSESEEFDIWRNKEKEGAVLFLGVVGW